MLDGAGCHLLFRKGAYIQLAPQVMSGDELNVAAPCDFFQLLNVGFDATPAEVRAAYRALQLSVHPDIVGMRAPAPCCTAFSRFACVMHVWACRMCYA